MDTNWKKSKLALRILCGWLAVLCLLGAVFLAYAAGPRRLLAGGANGMADLLAGRVTGSVEYQQQMAGLFYSAAMVAAGAEDSAGHSLTDAQNLQIRAAARQLLQEAFQPMYAVSNSDLLYCVVQGEKTVVTNTSAPLYDQGQVAPPLGYSVALAVQNGQGWGNRALLDAYAAYQTGQDIRPNRAALRDCTVVFAVRETPQPGSFVYAISLYVRRLRIIFLLFLGCAAGALAFGLVCLVQRKRGRAARQWAAGLTGRLVLEAKLALWLAVLLGAVSVFLDTNLMRPAVGFAVALVWALTWLTAVDLACNKGGVFRHSLVAKGWRAVRETVRLALHGLPWQRRMLLSLAACWLGALALTLLFPMLLMLGLSSSVLLVPALLDFLLALGLALNGLRLLGRWLRDAARLTDKMAELRQGQVTQPLLLAPASPLAGAAADLNALEEGIARAVEERGRADRLKVELVTNVSHDLKTPLTSIINYAELLCAEPLEGAAADYAKVIQQKADRLKAMVQDVFDLSKATSGNLPLAPKAIDLAKLVRQTLADMDEAIAASPLTFKTALPPEAWVQADGDRLYRVFQNLFTNALQYSLPGSRVYVELVCGDGRAVASVKNVARYEMDFDPDAITERFVRGDVSRTGEGSGLGLSIAKSFTEACGGSFSVRAEADLFCASVALELTEKPAESPQEAPPPQDLPEAVAPAGAGAL